MKKLALLATVAFAFVSCQKDAESGYTITGDTKGVDNGTKVYLQIQGENELVPKDTVTVENGKFQFKGTSELPELGFLTVEGSNGIPFILENGAISIAFDKDSLQNNKIAGTVENDIFQEFTTKNNAVYDKIMSYQKENQEKYMTAQSSGDTATVNGLIKDLEEIKSELADVPVQIITNNPKSFVGILLTENQLLRQEISVDEAQKRLDNFEQKLLDTRAAKNIKSIIEAANSVEIGKKAPDFSAPSPEGKEISLKESLGKVTIIDFWASWCGPCRMENPHVVELYNHYHDKGLNIIGVSLDKDEAKWKEAIAKDGLTWNHISNLKFWADPIAEKYNVKAIPATFIVDANGVIIAKDLRGAELDAKIKELLGE
ncbi:AhpC/TSA family protein [Flavobacterium sp. NRK F10]|uniref:TlpA disulfide reductase family protein n=1 Tax=Flavobacterium sp. NRK F10 TaxID=2954931 RepID=UPI00209034A6|nr:TlpA disulfide reductase family protein [Flavobacterium sp. NRK F10]MCO6173670.1 AhpC/TSA family protein [Flavobacterium sp. NRK F10]